MIKRILRRLKKRHYLIAAVLVVFAVIMLVFVFNRKEAAPPLTVQQLYQIELKNLSNDLTELDQYIDNKQDIGQDLNQYTSGLNNLKNPCRQMNIYHERYKNAPLTDPTKDAMSNTRQLCIDFLEVLDYSQAIFSVTGSYLTINTQNWPQASSDNFVPHINSLDKTITLALEGMKNVKNTVEDPAIHELMAQIEIAQAKLRQSQDAKAKNDIATADAYARDLKDLLTQDKIDFINARAYFWRNTVQLDALQNTVLVLEQKFN